MQRPYRCGAPIQRRFTLRLVRSTLACPLVAHSRRVTDAECFCISRSNCNDFCLTSGRYKSRRIQPCRAMTLGYLDVGYHYSRNTKLQIDVFNRFNRAASDIDYFYTSRLQGEPTDGVDDIHFHPVESRAVRLRFDASFLTFFSSIRCSQSPIVTHLCDSIARSQPISSHEVFSISYVRVKSFF